MKLAGKFPRMIIRGLIEGGFPFQIPFPFPWFPRMIIRGLIEGGRAAHMGIYAEPCFRG